MRLPGAAVALISTPRTISQGGKKIIDKSLDIWADFNYLDDLFFARGGMLVLYIISIY